MHAVEIAMPQKQDSWCSWLHREGRDVRVRMDAQIAVEGDRMVEVVTLQGPGVSGALACLQTRIDDRFQVLEKGPEHARLRVVVPVCPVVRVMQETGLVPRFPVPVEAGWDHWVVVDQKEPLKGFIDALRSQRAPVPHDEVRFLRSGPVRVPQGLMTQHQRKVLEAAFEAGYYDRPRRVTVRDLASSLGMSKSALSEALMAAEHKVMRRIVSGGVETENAQA